METVADTRRRYKDLIDIYLVCDLCIEFIIYIVFFRGPG